MSSQVKLCMPMRPGWMLYVVAVALGFLSHPAHAQSVDGGRSDLPGMKQDIFDQVSKAKKGGKNMQKPKQNPECPKSDMTSAFYSMAFSAGKIFVRINTTEGKCERLISIGGANQDNLTNYSKSCGPVGEYKRRIAENMSSVFFQGGFEWPKNDQDFIEIVTEEGTYEATVSEAKYENLMECWQKACGCEQANNPAARGVMMAMLAIAVCGVGKDLAILGWGKLRGKKPPKRVECKNAHRMEEGEFKARHVCDVCAARGCTYRCGNSCNYDMCKKCYKAAKATVKVDWEKWCEKHPEDKKKEKKDKDEKKGKKEDDKDDEDSGSEKKSDKLDSEDEGKETGDDSGKDSGKDTGDESKTEDDKSEKEN